MKYLAMILAAGSFLILTSCEVQSGITKKSVEKYQPTPTPSIAPTPTEEPIDPSDVVQVDTGLRGATLSINEQGQKKRIICDKYNPVMINNHDNVVTITGACSQIMINGDRNEITADAVMEIIFNGSDNKVRYSRFVNGNRPIVADNKTGNLTEKIRSSVDK
jgi:hypothetical protein